MFEASWLSVLADHLWQSTILIGAAWLLTLALRKNQARIRYWIWLIASLKLLAPFSFLLDAGRRLGAAAAAPTARPAVSSAIEQIVGITQPFQQTSLMGNAAQAMVAHHAVRLPSLLLALWALGSLAMAFSWACRWWQIRAAVRVASPRNLAADVPVLSSTSLLEPGVFGIVKPRLLLPEGITDRLTQDQLNAIVAHEMCHIRRRDNLTFAMHMMVETVFWFHPAVWWIRARLIEERERACDEAVVQSGSEADVYAEGILNVCKFYVESPLACAAGVTGSDLRQRIVRIMTGGAAQKLSLGRKLLLSAVAMIALSLPIVLGLLHATQIFAQTKLQDDATTSPPEFEVATIKPNKSGDNRMSFLFSSDGLSLSGIPVQMMLRETFNVQDDRILGAPGWVKSDRFDVEAKVSSTDAPKLDGLSIEQRRLMLRPLLEERFNLKYHHETRELPVYVLVVAKGGSMLKDSPPQGAEQRSGIRMDGPGSFEGMNAKLNVLSHVLSEQPEIGHTIVDKTGLTGRYDFALHWTPANRGPMGSDPGSGPDGNSAGGAPPADANGPSLFTALQEQLGLKLEAQKGPVDVIVIDHIDMPSQN